MNLPRLFANNLLRQCDIAPHRAANRPGDSKPWQAPGVKSNRPLSTIVLATPNQQNSVHWYFSPNKGGPSSTLAALGAWREAKFAGISWEYVSGCSSQHLYGYHKSPIPITKSKIIKASLQARFLKRLSHIIACFVLTKTPSLRQAALSACCENLLQFQHPDPGPFHAQI